MPGERAGEAVRICRCAGGGHQECCAAGFFVGLDRESACRREERGERGTSRGAHLLHVPGLLVRVSRACGSAIRPVPCVWDYRSGEAERIPAERRDQSSEEVRVSIRSRHGFRGRRQETRVQQAGCPGAQGDVQEADRCLGKGYRQRECGVPSAERQGQAEGICSAGDGEVSFQCCKTLELFSGIGIRSVWIAGRSTESYFRGGWA